MVVETAEPAIGNTAGEGVRYGACGILGGEDGITHRYTLHSGNREPRAIKTKETGIDIRPGDRLVLESGGGGGWGDAVRRDAAAIVEDAANGFVTAETPSPALREREGPAPKAWEGEGGAAAPSPGSLRSPPSPAVRERGF
jgi:N-methylhydantoinase B/oxoprolinase/acetone carboxylase alpha subunit